ncbi:glycosyltransferase [Actinoplanes sp. NPDC051851]|uniref:glycosyltransferase n=1 Tax=Actinoplanes sp. NPDC051851 TaxID=3154753 RepID=UPI003428B591
MVTEPGVRKPRLVFFRMLQQGLPDFIRLHLREQVECLERSFDVVVIDHECDFGQVCDQYRPDLVLFESGAYTGKRQITNTAAHPEVPRLGFIHSDAYCLSRAASIADMARWGVEAFVSISVAMAEYTPEIADDLFVWPNFVDPGLYRDYAEPKLVPVFFTGSQAIHYPWRNRVSRAIAPNYPSLTTPHGGWFNQGRSARMVYGERYARLLNASEIVPTCGTIAKEVVRKHFEIPASRACLLTERTAAVEAAGFVDMENCVFADEQDVLDKLDHLFRNPDELARITDAGHRLVHTRHTAAQRDQVYQWYRLRTERRPGQRIVQPGPFAPLELAGDTATGNRHVISGGLDRVLMRTAGEDIRRGRFAEAENAYLRCLNYHFMPEPVLGLARVALHTGRPDHALQRLQQTIEGTLLTHHSAEPDPVEWAYMVRALLCAGRSGEAVARAREYPGLRHPELDRIRSAVGLLNREAEELGEIRQAPVRASVHVLDQQSFVEWAGEFAAMLTACGQDGAAARLREHGTVVDRLQPHEPVATGGSEGNELLAKGRLLRRKVHRRLEYEVRRRLHRPEQVDAFTRVVRDLTEKEDLTDVLLLGTAGPEQVKALTEGLGANPNRPAVVSVRPGAGVVVDEHATGRPAGEPGGLAAFRARRAIEGFDLVVVADEASAAGPHATEALGAAFVLLLGISTPAGYELCGRMLADPRYVLLDNDPDFGTGYAVFRRRRRTRPATGTQNP